MTQWSDDIRLTNATGNSVTSINNSKCIASNGDTIHIVWYDLRDGNEEIYYKRSTDNGTSWEPDVRLTNSIGQSNYPAIFVSGLKVRVAWRDTRDGNYEEYYKQSEDGGNTWGSDIRLTNAQNTSSIPSIFKYGNFEYLVWHDYRDDPNGNVQAEIYFKFSTNDGSTWNNDVRLTDSPNMAENPSITVSNNIIHIVWADYRIGGAPEIYYIKSSDNGLSWSPETQLSNNPTSLASNNPCIVSSSSNIFVVWNDNRNFHGQIYFKKSSDNGMIWDPERSLSNDSSQSYNASLSCFNQQLHFVCYDDRNGYFKIYYQKSLDLGQTWSTELNLVDENTGGSSRPSLCISNHQVNIVWCDTRAGNFEIYYKKNPSGLVFTNNEVTNLKSFLLAQNFPNPFNPVTNINFGLNKGSHVILIIYDQIGREVSTLVNEELKPGTYETVWDGSNFSSGVYFYKIITEGFVATKKMVLMK